MFFRQISEPNLAQYAYLIGCQQTGEALLIDPQRDIDRYERLAAAEDLRIVAVTETHIHADFLSGAREFAEKGIKILLSDAGPADWQYDWAKSGNYDFQPLYHGDTFQIGNIEFKTLHTPGHTPEHISFLVTDHGGGADEPMGIASGDFVFVGDLGRPDLLETAAGEVGAREPSAQALYASVQEFLQLPDYLQIWPGHGAGSACGKALGAVPESTVGYERRFNPSIQAAQQGESTFVSAILDGQPEPPLYFARMKRENRSGPAVLGSLPQPARLSGADLRSLGNQEGAVILDTRADRCDFMCRHIAGSLYAGLGKSFPTVAGSYILPENPIFLIVEQESDVEDIVRNLIRIGLDHVVGFALLEDILTLDGLTSLTEIQTTDLEDWRCRDDVIVLDVRRRTEYDEAHIPDAQNIAHTRLLAHLAECPRDKKLLVHCRSGGRSAVAAALLAKHGFDAVYINGWFKDWQALVGQPEVV